MPKGPDQACYGSGGQKAVRLGKLRHEIASPPNFLAEYCSGTADYSEGCREEKVQDDCGPRRERPQTERLHQTFDEHGIIETAKAAQPDSPVYKSGIGQRNE